MVHINFDYYLINIFSLEITKRGRFQTENLGIRGQKETKALENAR